MAWPVRQKLLLGRVRERGTALIHDCLLPVPFQSRGSGSPESVRRRPGVSGTAWLPGFQRQGVALEVLDLVVGDGHIRIYFVVGAPGTHKTTRSTVGERRGEIRAFDAVTLAGLGHDGRVVFAVGVTAHGFSSIRAIPPV